MKPHADLDAVAHDIETHPEEWADIEAGGALVMFATALGAVALAAIAAVILFACFALR